MNLETKIAWDNVGTPEYSIMKPDTSHLIPYTMDRSVLKYLIWTPDYEV